MTMMQNTRCGHLKRSAQQNTLVVVVVLCCYESERVVSCYNFGGNAEFVFTEMRTPPQRVVARISLPPSPTLAASDCHTR